MNNANPSRKHRKAEDSRSKTNSALTEFFSLPTRERAMWMREYTHGIFHKMPEEILIALKYLIPPTRICNGDLKSKKSFDFPNAGTARRGDKRILRSECFYPQAHPTPKASHNAHGAFAGRVRITVVLSHPKSY